jgi:uncharacterized lipoprotein YmbA
MNRRSLSLAALAVVPMCVTGCSILQPRPDRTRYYSLSAVAGPGQPGEQPMGGDLTVGLGPLKLPDYLNRTERAIRVGPNQLRYIEDDRWAEPIDANVARVLSQDLTARLGTARVLVLPTLQSARRTYDVPLEILRFESTANGNAELDARWGIKDGKTGEFLFTAETQIVEPATDSGTDAAVAALSRALGRWSDEIGAALTRVRATPSPSSAEDGRPTRRKGSKESRR